VPEDAWDASALPEHLRMKVRLVDQQGRALATGEDLIKLKRRHGGGDAAAAPAAAPSWDHSLERDGITRWDFGTLPEHVDTDRAGIRLRGFPALVDRGDSVSIRVLDAEATARAAMRAGLRRLIMLTLAQDLRYLRRNLPGLDRMRLQYAKAPQPGPTNGGRGRPDRQQAGQEADRPGRRADRADPGPDLHRGPAADPRSGRLRATHRRAQGRLMRTADEVCGIAAGILDAYQQLRKRLAGITQINWMPSVLDLREQLDALVFRGFLQQVPVRASEGLSALPEGRQPAHRKAHPRRRPRSGAPARADPIAGANGANATPPPAPPAVTTPGWTRSAGCWKSCACRCSRSSSAPPTGVGQTHRGALAGVGAVGWVGRCR
jgi:ATP-dependent helicase HrpA